MTFLLHRHSGVGAAKVLSKKENIYHVPVLKNQTYQKNPNGFDFSFFAVLSTKDKV